MAVNPAVRRVAAPPIPEARRWAERYDGRHGPAIDLTQAVPGYPPPPELVARMVDAAADPDVYGYGDIAGDAALREAYAADMSALYGAPVAADEVAITAGANLASYAVTTALCAAGDALMLPTPWYFNHEMNAGLLGVDVVPLPCRAEDGFVPDPDRARALLHERVRAIVLVTPNNPTGAVYPPSVVEAFAALAAERGIALILDETYRDFRPADLPRPHDLFSGRWRESVVQIYSFSKSYCVPGFRAGAITAGRPFLDELAKVLDCLQICPPRIGQAALAWAIGALPDWRERNRALMNERGGAAARAFAALDGWRVDSLGAYFAYLRHSSPGRTSWAVAERLAAEHGIMTLPGEVFGPDQRDHLRLAFANVDAARIADAVERLRAAG